MWPIPIGKSRQLLGRLRLVSRSTAPSSGDYAAERWDAERQGTCDGDHYVIPGRRVCGAAPDQPVRC